MRVLAIETSSRRGTLALVEDGATVVVRQSVAEGAHAERLFPLLDEAFAEAGWARTSVDRLGVGIGPGSFTGLRVGVALAQGIGLGLARPVLGVSSLRAMCRAVPADVLGVRAALVDARRGEVFAGAYSEAGVELVAPFTVARTEVAAWAAEVSGVVVGEPLEDMEGVTGVLRSELTDLPHAVAVAWVAAELPADAAPAEPAYVRPVDAIRPVLPRSPLSSGDPR